MSNREYMREYMGKYRQRQAWLDGRGLDSKQRRPQTTKRAKRPLPVVETAGWPTKAQLMARR
jgi:hypothetical protein